MDYSKIPLELKELKQWVCCWDNSKIPMKAFEKKAASSSAPETWSTFDQATEAVKNGYYDHIGFVFNSNHLVGIDIDAGFNDGLMTPLCADIMSHCKSYTEKSRSGRGVHIFLRGDLPFPGKNNLNGVEIYQSKRFFIMTGKKLIFPEIIENQNAIDYIIAKYFVEGRNSAHDGVFESKATYYIPEYKKPVDGKITLRPTYPKIKPGTRNISLASLAGSLHNAGFNPQEIYKELLYVNQTACEPPLSQREVESITASITKYRR